MGRRAKQNGQLLLRLPGEVTPTTIKLPSSYGYDDWARTLLQVAHLGSAANWWQGDLLNWGETRFGEQYAQAASDSGLSEDALQARKWVDSRIPAEIRIEPRLLSWSHHRLVANAAIDDTDERAKWLKRAVESRWTVKELDAALKEAGLIKSRKKQVQFEASDPSAKVCPICKENEPAIEVCEPCASAIGASMINGKLTKPQQSLLQWAFEYIGEPPESAGQDELSHWKKMFDRLKAIVNKKGVNA